MPRLRRLLARLAALVGRAPADADLAEELETHLALLEADLRRQGLSASDARRTARRRLGGVTHTTHAVRDARLHTLVDQLRQEGIWACRALRASPAFTLTTTLTMALAIGGTMSVFTIVNVVLMQPLPYPDSERVVALTGAEPISVSGEMIDALRARLEPELTLAAVGGTTTINLRAGAHAVPVSTGRVSREYFDVLGVAPHLGRAFTSDEDRRHGPAVVVLSDGFWRAHLAGRPDVVGETLHLGGVPHTVVGVMPPDFRSFPAAQVWRPLRLSPRDQGANYLLLTRLPATLSLEAARARLETARTQVRQALERAGPFAASLTWRPYREVLGSAGRDDLVILQAATLCALLLACVNVAGLQLVRAGARQSEWATRAAIGGGPARLVRQMTVEAVLLGGLGVVAGLLLAWLAVPLIVDVLPPSITAGRDVAPDGRVLVVGAALLLLVALTIGVVPARAVWRVDLRSAIGAGGRQTTTRSTRVWRQTFVVTQLALALVLVVGALLLARTLANYHRVDLGFEPAGLVAGTMTLHGASDATAADPARFIEQTLDEIRRLPGVADATVASNLPVERALNLAVEPPPGGRIAEPRAVDWQYVASGYRATLGTALRSGRDFDASDTAASRPVAIVNEAFARTYFGDEPAVGHEIRLAVGDLDVARTIVGVVADVRATSGTGWTRGRNALDAPAAPGISVPLAQVSPELLAMVHDFARVHWLVRTTGDAASVERDVTALMRSREPQLPFIALVPLTTVVARELTLERALLWLMTALGASALLLAGIGAYGLLAAGVQARTRDIAIRLALGATRARVVREVTIEGARLLAIALVCGVPAAIVGARALRAYLWGVGPSDAATLAGAAIVLVVVGAAAVLIPANRAGRVAPARVLRSS